MSNFPKVEITGGPHGKNLTLKINGAEPEKVSRVELAFDVNDVVRMKTFQYVEAHVDVEFTDIEDGGYTVDVRIPDVAEGTIRTWDTVASGKGQTIRAALLDVANKVEGRYVPKPGEEMKLRSVD